MMYQNKLVACVKVHGRILREQHGVVLIPFGSEYSLLLKNLNSRRVKLKVSVDGQDATSGTWLVVPANNSMELERFIRDGNWSTGNRFKFIERTGEIEAHRGIQSDDGLVRIEYAREKRVVDQPIVREHYYDEWYPVPRPYPWYPPYPKRRWSQPMRSGTRMRCMNPSAASAGNVQQGYGGSQSANFTTTGGGGASGEAFGFYDAPEACSASAGPDSAEGITVPGSLSHQQFHAVEDFLTDQSDVMVLTLRGIVGSVKVNQAITVDAKPTCSSCGRTHKSDAAFCQSCGTALVFA